MSNKRACTRVGGCAREWTQLDIGIAYPGWLREQAKLVTLPAPMQAPDLLIGVVSIHAPVKGATRRRLPRAGVLI